MNNSVLVDNPYCTYQSSIKSEFQYPAINTDDSFYCPPNHQQSTFLPKIHANEATYNSSRHLIAIIAFRQVQKCQSVIPLTDCEKHQPFSS